MTYLECAPWQAHREFAGAALCEPLGAVVGAKGSVWFSVTWLPAGDVSWQAPKIKDADLTGGGAPAHPQLINERSRRGESIRQSVSGALEGGRHRATSASPARHGVLFRFGDGEQVFAFRAPPECRPSAARVPFGRRPIAARVLL